MQILPNEVLLQICRSLDPYDVSDQQSLLSLRLTCCATREFATTRAFHLLKLRHGHENARKQIFSMFEHTRAMHSLETLEINIKSMMPTYLLLGHEEPFDEVDKIVHETGPICWKDEDGGPNSVELDRRNAVRYARDFCVQLSILFRFCNKRITEIRLDSTWDDDLRSRMPFNSNKYWSEAFWQSFRIAMEHNDLTATLKSLDLRAPCLMDAFYIWMSPQEFSTEKLISWKENPDAFDYIDPEEQELNDRFADLRSLRIVIEDDQQRLFEESNGEFVENEHIDAELLMEILPRLERLKSLDLEFGRLYSIIINSGPFLGPSEYLNDTNEWTILTQLRLHRLVDDHDELFLLNLLHCLNNLEQLHLYFCSIALLEDLDMELFSASHLPIDPSLRCWKNIFDMIALDLKYLTDICIEGLDYIEHLDDEEEERKKKCFKNQEKIMSLRGWTCGIPLHSPLSEDYEALRGLTETVQTRRVQAKLSTDKWLSGFLEKETVCWQARRFHGINDTCDALLNWATKRT